MSLNYIELFAGCGGLSLGLESVGFKLIFANELSPMAGETFAYNILREDLKIEKAPMKTLWINSKYPKGDTRRLTENPQDVKKKHFNDLDDEANIKGKLIIGDLIELTKYIKKNRRLRENLRNEKIALVSGGPPCQSFSLAGRREINNKRNRLPWAFIDFVELTQPKMVLLENVSGILRAFKDGDKKYYAWFEVSKAFCLKNYVPICMHINAKYFGIPQNRPRFILLAIKRNLIGNEYIDNVMTNSLSFFEKVNQTDGELAWEESGYHFYELTSNKDIDYFKKSRFLPTPKIKNEKDFKTAKYAIGAYEEFSSENTISSSNLKNDRYHQYLSENFPYKGEYIIMNHNFRGHNQKIVDRFQFLKIINDFDNGDVNKLQMALKTGSHTMLGQRLVDAINMKIQENNLGANIEDFLMLHQSKKHSQRALKADKPAPATLSIPDDVCHFAPGIDRTLSVREMARIQSFPDWFIFRSKDTTGGNSRRFEVPNYTQVGNAVPPLLGKALGNWIKNIYKLLEDEV